LCAQPLGRPPVPPWPRGLKTSKSEKDQNFEKCRKIDHFTISSKKDQNFEFIFISCFKKLQKLVKTLKFSQNFKKDATPWLRQKLREMTKTSKFGRSRGAPKGGKGPAVGAVERLSP
jgi:hypothetical protein